jgi:radical SAM superfamily enzyme YgiQ (UPF0313 family)
VTLALEDADRAMLSTSPGFFVVLTSLGIIRPGVQGREEDLPLGLPELSLLEALVDPTEPVSQVVEQIAEKFDTDPAALRTLVDELANRGLVGGAGDSAATAPTDAVLDDDEPDPQEPVVLSVPIILRLRKGGFEMRDHDGRLRVLLTAQELIAATTLVAPTTIAKAVQAHRAQVGPHAMKEVTFRALVRRLAASRWLKGFDPDAPYAYRYDRLAESIRREILGRQAVERAIERMTAERDEIEAKHRERTGVARTKVLPVHAIKTAWRNPPLSLGLLLAYAEVHNGGELKEHYDFRPDWLVTEERLEAYADEPAVFLFSNYIWSTAPNLEISAKAKEVNPGNVTIHGGPDVPKYAADVEDYFRANPHVDITIRGEGEFSCAEVLEALVGHVGDGPVDLSVLKDVPGISYRDGDKVVRTADRDRITELDVIPSPYLTGQFDVYVEGWAEVHDELLGDIDAWSYLLPVVVLETNRGCPYGCTFCDWGSATLSRIRKWSLERVFAEIEWCAEHMVDTIGLADANFGIMERDVEITQRVADLKNSVGFPRQFGTNYAKNTVKHLQRIVEILAGADILSYGLLSLQAMDEDTLDTIKRSNIKLEKYEQLAQEFRKAKLPLYVDLMVGLPGQTVRSFRNDMQECANREVHTKIFQTQLLVNSPMNDPAYRKEHGIVTKPGFLVLESASFTRADYDRMLELRIAFFLMEKFGVLRHVARYVRHETGEEELDFYARIYDESREHPERWPVIDFTMRHVPRFMVPPVSWKVLLDEVREFVVVEYGIADDSALDTAIEAQHALLPAVQRTFPFEVELKHDYGAWHEAVMQAKEAGHLDDWPTVVAPLREFGPGTLLVDDPRGVSQHEMGRTADSNPWDSWDLDSPVSRAAVTGM